MPGCQGGPEVRETALALDAFPQPQKERRWRINKGVLEKNQEEVSIIKQFCTSSHLLTLIFQREGAIRALELRPVLRGSSQEMGKGE